MSETWLKRIGFYTGGPPFDGSTLAGQALGGSETALIQATRALRDRGHEVTVFNNCSRAADHEGVLYLPVRTHLDRMLSTRYEVFIASRLFDCFSWPLQARLKVLWNHDLLDRPAALRQVQGRFDLMLVLSRFHRRNYLTHLPDLANRLIVTRNGLDLNLIKKASQGVPRNPNKVIYASRPERGLKILLEGIWPRLAAIKPDLKLHICGYNVDRTILPPGLLDLYDYLAALMARSPNVVNLGSLSKEDYYRHLAESALMLYPCTFPEVSCLAVLEAQACRTPVLTTDDFALSETVRMAEFRIPGRPGRPSYDQMFLERAIQILTEPGWAVERAGRAAAMVEKEHDWSNIVAEWDRAFDLTLASKTKLSALKDSGIKSHAALV
ncbi:MAG: glycosyltransferase family 4 protein [Thermodesulfobacteriota bacterium]